MKKIFTLCSVMFLGAYAFSQSVGLIGSSVDPYDWTVDIDLATTDNVMFTGQIDLVVGEAKFRQDNDWAINWGAVDFPAGTGLQDGPNIPIATAGLYDITFDISTGDYTFTLASNGITENNAVNGLVVAPNPVKDVVTFSFDVNGTENVSVNVYDVAGKVVATQNASNLSGKANVIVMNVASLNAGSYIYTVVAGEKVSTGKLSKF
jgi:starch-binding outer membrane protein SusE/F